MGVEKKTLTLVAKEREKIGEKSSREREMVIGACGGEGLAVVEFTDCKTVTLEVNKSQQLLRSPYDFTPLDFSPVGFCPVRLCFHFIL